MDVSKLEPAERNFKREFTTLIVILVVAFAAGSVILYSYVKMRQRQNEEVSKGRPPEMGELVKNFSFKNKNNALGSFFDCTGKVTLLACFAADQLEESHLVLEALKRLAKIYEAEDRVRILLLSLDDAELKPISELRKKLELVGISGPKWEIAAANGALFLAYLKKQMKFIHLSSLQKEGKWIVPQRIRLLGPDLKLRGRESEYDIGKAYRDTLQARKELKNNIRFKQNPDFRGDVSKIDLVNWTEKTIEKAVNYILEHENFEKKLIDEGKMKNIYKPYLYLFAGFIVFVILLGLKVSRKRAQEELK